MESTLSNKTIIFVNEKAVGVRIKKVAALLQQPFINFSYSAYLAAATV